MAPWTYYYCISVVLVVGITFWIVNLVYLRTNGKTFYGQVFKSGTPEYKRILKLASNQNITISSLADLAFVLNLVASAVELKRHDPSNAGPILLYAPIIILLLAVFMVFYGRKQFGNYGKGKRS